MQDCKDGSGLQFTNFDFVTGGQEIIVSICFWWKIEFLNRYFLFLVHISLCLSLLAFSLILRQSKLKYYHFR